MAVVRKKQDDKYLKALRELVSGGGSGGNRQCFDCGQKGPTYVNMTIGSFVCTRCSGVLRGLTPPHRVKSISMATFTQEEIDFLKAHGNELCAKTWLGLWDPKRAVHQDHRELMIDKYERKRYFLEPASPLKSLTNAASASLKTNSQPTTTAATSSIQINNNSSSNGNNSQPQTNGHHKQNGGAAIDNSFQNIQLTPPTSQRTTANGLHKNSSTAISRPQQNGYNHHQQQQQQQHHQDAFMVNNSSNNQNNNIALLNGLSSLNGGGVGLNIGSAASSGALSDTSSCASNGFGPDADFVADFGSANIFDATSAGSVGSPAVSSASSVASSNGYAKIQPIRAAHQQFMNGNANAKQQLLPLNGAGGGGTTSSTCNNGNAENFADFDHAPIFTAAENYQFIRKKNLKKQKSTATKFQQQQQQQLRQPQSNATIETNNFFANLRQATTTERVANSSSSTNNKNGATTSSRSAADIIFSESTSNFNDPFDDFNSIVVGNSDSNSNKSSIANSSMHKFAAAFETDFEALDKHAPLPPPQQPAPKFTPLAMAAHATAMAVLGSNSHFNSNNNNSTNNSSGSSSHNFSEHITPFDQWDVWQDSTLDSSTTTPTAAAATAAANFANTGSATAAWPSSSSNNSTNNRFDTATGNAAVGTANNAYTYTMLSNNSSSSQHTLASVPVPPLAAAASPASSHPMPNGIGKNSTATASANAFNNNHKLNSTPAEDRYAALKDLDEQLRESKAVAAAAASIVSSAVVDSFGNNNNNNNNGHHSSNAGSVNPFKSQQQQQQHQQQVNPFQATAANNAHQQQHQQHQQQILYGQMTVIPNGIATNGFAAVHQTPPTQHQAQLMQQQQQQQHQATAFFNYSNGFAAAAGNGANAPSASMFPTAASSAGGPNGCGFGFGTMQQQIAATGGGMGGGAFNNPFAANSNNPFL